MPFGWNNFSEIRLLAARRIQSQSQDPGPWPRSRPWSYQTRISDFPEALWIQHVGTTHNFLWIVMLCELWWIQLNIVWKIQKPTSSWYFIVFMPAHVTHVMLKKVFQLQLWEINLYQYGQKNTTFYQKGWLWNWQVSIKQIHFLNFNLRHFMANGCLTFPLKLSVLQT